MVASGVASGVALWWALGVMVFCLLVELLHARRCRKLAHLAFGTGGRPRVWTRATPTLRIAAVGLCAWGLVVLFELRPMVADFDVDKEEGRYHLVLGLDVSPSMDLTDSGQNGQQTRADRAREILRSALQRVDLRRTRVSIPGELRDRSALYRD